MTPDVSRNYCIVTKSDSGPIALIQEEGSLKLPTVSLPADCWVPNEAAEINAQLMESWGLNCTLLRCQKTQSDRDVLIMEWHPGSPEPEFNVLWIDPGKEGLLLSPDELEYIRHWRETCRIERVPWENPGWMKNVVLSLMRIFNGVHYPQLTNLAQIKAAWGMSTVILIETSQENYYFKAGTRQGIDEGVLTKLIHQRFPRYAPDPLMVDGAKGWMITRNIENQPIEAEDYDFIRNGFRAYGEVQLGCGDFFATGLAPGIRVRNANWFQSCLDAFFGSDRQVEFDDLKSRLNNQQLSKLGEIWRRQVDVLRTSLMPPGLVQEDFHYGNLLQTPGGPVIIDWADCAIAHPFFGYNRTFESWKDNDSEVGKMQKHHATRGYLEAFSSVGDTDLLEREINITRPLLKLYQAFRWQEVAAVHPVRTYWGRHSAAHAARFMEEAINLITAFDTQSMV